MPIRINLKEVFPSDAQEINVDKINYNFNRLLELGVGTPGARGKVGNEGSAGPIGPTGLEGERGNKWYVGNGDPNAMTFTDLIDGDFYLDSDSSSVWQYDGASSPMVWNLVTDLSNVVNNFLLTQGVTFVRGFGDSSPFDDRYITFANRGDNSGDVILDTTLGNNSNNDILFLNNFNETFTLIDNFPVSTDSEYNALQKVHVDHSILQLGRYHMELGSLYLDTRVSPGDAKLSELKHNLKTRFIKDDIYGSATYPASNHFVNIARHSLSKPELAIPSEIDENGMFEFIVPKYNNEGATITEEVFLRFGAKEANGEYSPGISLSDGIEIINGTYATSFGIATDFYDGGNYGLIDVANLDAIFLNNEVIQTGGNITQVVTTNPKQIDVYPVPGSNFISFGQYMNQGIIASGDSLWIATGQGNTTDRDSTGLIQKVDISDPSNPNAMLSIGGRKKKSWTASPGTSWRDQHNHVTRRDGIRPDEGEFGFSKDIAEFGRYAIVVSHGATGPFGGGYNPTKINLTVVETDSSSGMYVVDTLNSVASPEISDAYRILVNGKYAWVITNRNYTSGPQDSSSLNQARITAVDLTDPENVTIADSYQEQDNGTVPGKGTKYLDFDIYDNKAIVLKYTNYFDAITPPDAKHELELLVFDIQDPNSFSSLTYTGGNIFPGPIFGASFTPASTSSLNTFGINGNIDAEHGGIVTSGKHIYIVHKDSFYIHEFVNNYATTSVSTSQLFSIAPAGTTASDIKVSGRYAYILVNYGDSTGSVQIWDISDPSSPEMVAETITPELHQSSRLTLNGKHLYIISSDNFSSQIITIDINGIDSPAARIGDLRVDDVNVLGDLRVKDNVNIKGALNVGPGGIYVDEGSGVTSDGIITTTKYVNTGASKVIMNLEKAFTIPPFPPFLLTELTFGAGYLRNRTIIDDLSIGFEPGLTGYFGVFADFLNIRNSSIGNGGGDNVVNFFGSTTSITDTTFNIPGSIVLNRTEIDSSTSISAAQVIINSARIQNVLDLDVDDAYLYYGRYDSNTGSATKWGIHIEGEDQNLLSGDLELGGNLDIDGLLNNPGDSITEDYSLDGIDIQNYWPKDKNVVSSGSYRSNSTPGFFFLFMNWQRVGNVVQVQFQGKINLSEAGSRFNIPHLNSGSNIRWLAGQTVVNNTGDINGFYVAHHAGYGFVSNSTRPIAGISYGRFQVTVDPDGSDYDAISGNGSQLRLTYVAPGLGIDSQEVGDDIGDNNAEVWGNFSYLITS